MRISDWSSDVCSSDLQARGLPSLAPPALDHAVQDFGFAAGLAPQAGEERIARRGALVLFERVEIDADRDRHALAADDALAVAQLRDRIDEAARAFVHRCLDEMLIALVVEGPRNDGSALRQQELKSTRLN